jgi:hypothetical protein
MEPCGDLECVNGPPQHLGDGNVFQTYALCDKCTSDIKKQIQTSIVAPKEVVASGMSTKHVKPQTEAELAARLKKEKSRAVNHFMVACLVKLGAKYPLVYGHT